MATPAATPQPGGMAIPLVDLSPLRQSPADAAAVQRLAAEVDRACRQVGFLCERSVRDVQSYCFQKALSAPLVALQQLSDAFRWRKHPCKQACRCLCPSLLPPMPQAPSLLPADVSGHGVSEEEMQGLLGLACRLFDLPLAAKEGMDASESTLARGCVSCAHLPLGPHTCVLGWLTGLTGW